MAKRLLLSTLLLLASSISDGRHVSPNELRSSLTDHNVPLDQLSTWECIVKHQAQFETDARNGNTHGIFLINTEWCDLPGRGCDMTCDALRDDNIDDDIECALQIYKHHTRLRGNAFTVWRVYEKYCAGL